MMENRAKFTIGVFGIIFNERDEVLLAHRTDCDLWNLPGGGLNDKEPPWEGVKREVEEEIGLRVEVVKLVGIYSKSARTDIAISFFCKIIDGQITTSDEADEIKYFDVSNLPPNTVPKQVERIKDALLNLPDTILKVQTGKSSIELAKAGKL